jgi:hypothetical protein
MSKLPTKDEIRDMRFSSLACKVHDWIHSTSRAVINKAQKTECAATIKLLEAKLEHEPENTSRIRVVERLRRDLESLLTYAEATRRKGAAAASRQSTPS